MSTGHRRQAPHAAQTNIATGNATQNIVQGGDQYLYQGEANYRIEHLNPHRPALSKSIRRQPSRLLAAGHQVVEFTGRELELGGLAEWRDGPVLGVAARLMHGPGGQGKTRVTARFAQLSAELGWTVAYAVHCNDGAARAGLDARLVADGRGLLLIVDYAERWPTGDLLALAHDPLLRTGVPTRVLMLGRPAGGWWDSLAYRLQDRFDIAADQIRLGALADTVPDRIRVFTAARDCFAALLDVPDADQVIPPARLSDDAFGLVLTLHMAALAAVDAHARGNTPPTDPGTLSAYLLHRERDHWRAMYENDQRVRTAPDMMARTVFTATLTRPLGYPAAVTALHRVGIPGPEQVIDDHRMCYPSADPATVCEPLYPDRLGEDFLALQCPGHARTSYQPDPWADTSIEHLLAPDRDGQPPGWTPATVTMLIETARRWPHIAHRQLYPLLREQPHLAMLAGGAALARLVELPEVDLGVLELLEAQLPTERHVDLDIAAAAVATRLTDYRLDATDDPATRARLHEQLSIRHANAGQREPALAAATQTVTLYRQLAAAKPATFEPHLARALNNLGNLLLSMGQQEGALSAATEAVEIRRRLAPSSLSEHLGGLASALNNRSMMLMSLGRWDQAARACTESVQICRLLVSGAPALFEPSLASALDQLSNCQSDLGRRDEALRASIEAVDIYRRLAIANPTAYEPNLAGALHNLGDRLSEVGQREKGLRASTEAVDVYRRLVAINPAAFEADFALALNNLGGHLVEANQPEPALGPATEAVDVYQRLASTNPAAFERDLSRALTNLGNCLWRLGRSEEALKVTTESTNIQRRLAKINPAAYGHGLAIALDNHSVDLFEAGLTEQARLAATEAVDVYRRLATANPGGFEPHLASTLTNLSTYLAAAEQREDALRAAIEAVDICRRLATASPAAHEPDLASALATLSSALLGVGQVEATVGVHTEAIGIYRRLAATDPDRHKADLARALSNLGNELAKLERWEQALATSAEAVDIRRQLAKANPATFQPALARGLRTFAWIRAAGRIELPQALSAAEESVGIYETLTKQRPQTFTKDLHRALVTQADILDHLHRTTEAASIRDRVIQYLIAHQGQLVVR